MEKKPVKEEANPYKLLELIPRERPWLVKTEDGGSDEKKLELRLGLPGREGERRSSSNKPKQREGYNGNHHPDHQPLSLDYYPSATHFNSSNRNNSASWSQHQKQDFPATWGHLKEPSQPCYSRMVKLPKNDEKNKAFSPSSVNTAVANSSQKRAAPVVGWPPIRSFRKNLASSSSAKPVLDPPSAAKPEKANENPTENRHKGLFIKINMDGVPIGRKVDLSTYNSYDKLCSAVDNLFRGLLAAQKDPSACGTENKQEGGEAITGLLDGSGEYTLVYEDNEGDRMLVGDVPWHMFVSTVKRLRLLKISKLPSLSKTDGKERKLVVE